MEEISSLKRQREESHDEEVVEQQKEDVFKRQKSYKDIITLLEEDEDVPNEDLSSLISTLHEEISSFSSPSPSPSPSSSEADRAHDMTRPDPFYPAGAKPGPGEEEERESVMRHLLEASDDELGIPNSNSDIINVTDGYDEVVGGEGGHVDGGDFIFNGEGIWEFEEYEAANYYSMLQQHSSEIFM